MARVHLMKTTNWLLSVSVNFGFILVLICYLTAHFHSPNLCFSWYSRGSINSNPTFNNHNILKKDSSCKGLEKYYDKNEECSFVRSSQGCQTGGYIPYLQLFYCTSSRFLGYVSIALWLVILFYLLGDTASNYFCTSLDGLSKILKLSPTIAGVTLLSLGNGAPDVFSSIVSFLENDTGDIGLSSILGSAFFVSSFVLGVISICVDDHGRKISRAGFTRSVLFLLFCLSCLLVIIIIGKINLWGALSFLSLYFIYVLFIFASEKCSQEETLAGNLHEYQPTLPVTRGIQTDNQDGLTYLNDSLLNNRDGLTDLNDPLLHYVLDERPNVSYQNVFQGKTMSLSKLWFILELPLYLPRRLTIPLVSEEKWSKPFAVVSTTLCPVLFALTWNFGNERTRLVIHVICGTVGGISGILTICLTDGHSPPRKCLYLWLGEGFLMSITWTYILAQELISLLVSVGIILGLNHSILGLTLLAWGNSIGDLVANVTVARKAGPIGAQIAVSGCYAGPMFNTVVGLGLSFAFSSWKIFPKSYSIPLDYSLIGTIGFLIVGLIWALVVLPWRKMRLEKFLGFGLLSLYVFFLFLRMLVVLAL